MHLIKVVLPFISLKSRDEPPSLRFSMATSNAPLGESVPPASRRTRPIHSAARDGTTTISSLLLLVLLMVQAKQLTTRKQYRKQPTSTQLLQHIN